MQLKTIALATMLATVSTGTIAAAGERTSATIQVTSSIPSTTFTVSPVGAPNFNHVKADLDYDTSDGSFSQWDLAIEATYDTGFKAMLGSTPSINNGTNLVPLAVTIDQRAIGSSPIAITDTVTSSTTSTHTLKITAANQPSLPTGIYSGTAQLIFEDGI